VEWQSLRTQEYRFNLLVMIARFWELFGVRRPVRYEKPLAAGDYEEVIHPAEPRKQTLMEQYLENQPKAEPRLGGKPPETGEPDEEP
jgi:hypothetical protein